ncbi:MAG: sensor histidine kinase [Pseudomonadota bacterium]
MTDTAKSDSLVGVWRPLRGPFDRWPNATDLIIALISIAATLLMWSSRAGYDGGLFNTPAGITTYLFAFIACFALLWRRSHPWQVHCITLSASILVHLGPINDGVVALAFSLYSLGRYEADRRVSIVGVLAAAVFVTTDLFLLSVPSVGGTIAAGLVIGLWYIGRRLRFRGEYLRLLEERANHLERERNVESERAVAAERTRIAREMHDVVAHQVSLMTVQAGAARTVSQSDPKAAGEAMAAVENAGRNALSEIRDLLDVLRPEEHGNGVVPQPGITDLPTLIETVNEAGLAVRLQTSGNLRGVSARVELTLYRIVQEALTNVMKHAGPGASATVRLSADDEMVSLSIEDNGEGGAAQPTKGHGIIGMRERAELLDGRFDAYAGQDGGFTVNTQLPKKANER